MRNVNDNDFTLKVLVPDSLMQDANIMACVEAIDPELRAVGQAIDFPALFARLDSLTGEQLDHIAESWNTYNWDDMWPVEQKRRVIRTALFEKCKRGTLYAVQKAVESVADSVTIVEWWQQSPPGPVHTFTIEVDFSTMGRVLDEDEISQIMRFVDYAKPVRSHYRFVIKNAGRGAMYLGPAAARSSVYARIRDCTQNPPVMISGILAIHAAARPAVLGRIR